MTYSKNGLALTEQFEGCKLTAYQDANGVWTIGYGHTGADVTPGLVITKEHAETLLIQDIGWACMWVNKVVKAPMTQGEFDALVDLCFNIGCGNFDQSTVLKAFNAGDTSTAAKAFEVWDKIHSVVSSGLLRRRIAEEAEFNAPASVPDATGIST